MDSRLGKFIEGFNGVSTKCLQNYLNWFLVLEKIKHSTKRMTVATAMALISNSAWFDFKDQMFNMLIRT